MTIKTITNTGENQNFVKTHLVHQISYDKKSVDMLMLRISYKLTKKTTKTENIAKSTKILKMINILNFKATHYKLTVSGNIFNFIVNYKFVRPLSVFRQPNE